MPKVTPGYCEICEKYYHYLVDHNKRMHNNGRETKKTKKKKKATKPPKKEATQDKNYESLVQELEDLRNENEVLHQHQEDIENLKHTVEQIKWALKGYIHFSERKKAGEETNNEEENKYRDCLIELNQVLQKINMN